MPVWRKSSYSGAQGSECVEVADLAWRKASRTHQSGECVELADLCPGAWRKSPRSAQGADACVEVAGLHLAVAVRDSKDPEGPKLAFSREAWRDLSTRAKAGELDL